jgi:hypothetical protein
MARPVQLGEDFRFFLFGDKVFIQKESGQWFRRRLQQRRIDAPTFWANSSCCYCRGRGNSAAARGGVLFDPVPRQRLCAEGTFGKRAATVLLALAAAAVGSCVSALLLLRRSAAEDVLPPPANREVNVACFMGTTNDASTGLLVGANRLNADDRSNKTDQQNCIRSTMRSSEDNKAGLDRESKPMTGFAHAKFPSSTMAQGGGSTLFVIVGRNEPLFEAEFLNKPGAAATTANNNNNNDTVTRQNYFVLHSALDLVEKAAWTTSNMYLRVVDKVGLFF